MTPNQLPPLPEPYTSQRSALTNPHREKLFTIKQMHAYALAALAQQARGPWIETKDEPPPVGVRVFWMDIHTNQVGYDTYRGEPYYFNSTHWMLIPTLSSTTPPAPQVPAPDIDEAAIARMTKRGADAWAGVDAQSVRGGEQVPAPVDERAEFEASMREKHGWVARDFQSDSFGYFDGHTATAWLAWRARASLQTKGQP